MVNDDNDYKLDVYKIDTRTKLDKKRIFIMVILKTARKLWMNVL